MKTSNDMRTPLNRVRGLGSAKKGTEHFWRQRITAVANIPLILYFIWTIVSLNGASHSEVVSAFSSPFTAVIMILVILSGVYHMWLGMQVVIEDYIHAEGTKIGLLLANTFFSILIAALSVYSIFKLGFGG